MPEKLNMRNKSKYYKFGFFSFFSFFFFCSFLSLIISPPSLDYFSILCSFYSVFFFFVYLFIFLLTLTFYSPRSFPYLFLPYSSLSHPNFLFCKLYIYHFGLSLITSFNVESDIYSISLDLRCCVNLSYLM